MIYNKRGVSVLIGYVLLVVFAVIIGAIVFAWLRSYVPGDTLNCPDGTSVFIREASFDDSSNQVRIILKNNGRFDIAGFFIHATNSSAQEVATIDLSNYSTIDDYVLGNSIVYVWGENSISPGDTNTSMFDLSASQIGEPYSVSIIPVRYQIEGNRERFVSCPNAKAESLVGEPVAECVPEDITITCGTWICGEQVNNCGDRVSCPPDNCEAGGQVCSGGACVPPAECTDTCATYGYECETWTICGVSTICGSFGGGCQSGFECNSTGQCVSLLENGICNPGETCAQEPIGCEGQQAQCTTGQTCQSGSCAWQGGAYGEDEYCIDLERGYTSGDCVFNSGQCTGPLNGVNEDDEPGAEIYCPGQILCCIPAP